MPLDSSYKKSRGGKLGGSIGGPNRGSGGENGENSIHGSGGNMRRKPADRRAGRSPNGSNNENSNGPDENSLHPKLSLNGPKGRDNIKNNKALGSLNSS